MNLCFNVSIMKKKTQIAQCVEFTVLSVIAPFIQSVCYLTH